MALSRGSGSAPPSRVAAWRLGLYASGNGAKNLVWSATELALLFIFTDLLGINPAIAGLLILASLIWDAALDPVIGAVADRVGSFGHLIFAGAPMLAASFIFLLAGPAWGLSGIGYAALALFAVRTAYSIVDIPHNALLVRLATDAQARNALAGVRFTFSALATLALGLVLPPILATKPLEAARESLAVFALIGGGAAAVILIAAALAARPYDQRVASDFRPARALWRDSFAPLSDANVRHVLMLALVTATATPLLAKALLHYATYVLNDGAQAGAATVAIALGQIAGAPLWIMLAQRWTTRPAFLAAHAVAALFALPLLAGAALPDWAFMATCVAHGVGASGVYILIWPLTASVADAHSARSDAAAIGAVFGLVIMIMQIGAGLGAGLLGGGLAALGFQAGAAPTPLVAAGIAAMAALGPALGALCALSFSARRTAP